MTFKHKNMTSAQKIVFKLLAKIQYGKIIINDPTGSYVFCGDEETDHYTVNVNVNNIHAYKMLLLNGTLAAGETYIKQYWDIDNLKKLIEIILINTKMFDKIENPIARFMQFFSRLTNVLSSSNIKQNKKNILAHYDLGNEFFALFLDPSMMYSCALYEPNTISLAEASKLKMERICQQLQLSSSDHLLEIGTGWGGFSIFAAQNYGCKITTTTISDKQYAYTKQRIEESNLQNQITLLNTDYRELEGSFDKIASIEMIEAIGYKKFDDYFFKCNSLVKPNGLFLLQAILINDQAYSRAKNETDFIKKYIFPGGCLPSMNAISQSIAKKTQFQLIEFHDIGMHYVKTLDNWLANFNKNITQIRALGFKDEFIRAWQYYFCYCAAAFERRHITDIHALWQKRD